MKNIMILLIIVQCLSACTSKKTEKKQYSRNNVVNVHNQVKEIKIDNVIISRYSNVCLIDKYLLISDSKSLDKIIHIFNKNTYKYIKSIGQQGPGPKEITNIGYLSTDEINKKIYVPDCGKLKIYRFDLDSALTCSNYTPPVFMNMNKKAFPSEYVYLNDTLSIGIMIKPTGNSGYNEEVVRLNFKSGKVVPLKYIQPDIIKKRVCFAVCPKDNQYVECYYHNDLMTITDLYGNLKYNIYGPGWKKQNNYNNHFQFYYRVSFCRDKIIAGYSDGKFRDNGYCLPTKFLVFNKDGDYIKTLEAGYSIADFIYDKDNNRIIMQLNDAYIQFAYLDLDGLL